jgi:hypothetical protein
MKNYLLPFISFVFIACHNNPAATKTNATINTTTAVSSYIWTKLLDSAAWKKSYNFQLFSNNDTLITLHGDGAWYNVQGNDWVKTSLSNIVKNQAFLDYVQFNGGIYGLGQFQGNIEQYTFTPAIHKTKDMQNWQQLSASSNLPHRFFYHPFVFNNKIWIIGGEDKNTQYADIWNSADGINWVQQKDNLPFGKRSNSQIVQLNNKLYLLNNDVWVSDDALNWTLLTPSIMPSQKIFGYAAVAYNNKIWLLGCNRDGYFESQVLVSADGKSWTRQAAPWTPRGGIAAAVHKNKVYMTGGKYGGTPNHPNFIYSNDVWALAEK